jgi:DNA-binding LytR/AlgR family response regulator
MQIEIKIDETCKEPKIVIVTNAMSNEINAIIKKLSDEELDMIAGFKDETVELLEPNAIYRIYSSGSKVLAETERGVFTIRLRLYKVEERLDSHKFLRISNSELINLKKVKSFDLSFAGTICVSLLNGTVTYASRRYVSKIKQTVGL